MEFPQKALPTLILWGVVVFNKPQTNSSMLTVHFRCWGYEVRVLTFACHQTVRVHVQYNENTNYGAALRALSQRSAACAALSAFPGLYRSNRGLLRILTAWLNPSPASVGL